MNEFPVVLVINCGSSSIKFSVLDVATCDVLMAGIADGMNTENAFLSINGDKPINLAHSNYEDALKAIAFELEKRDLTDSVALIGHRIAHGGELFTQSVIITDEIIDNIRRVSPLAPLHNYANLSGIDAARRLFPAVRQVAVFDTSFHQTLAPEAYLYGLPWEYFSSLGVRRYGFHGTSHRYVSRRAYELLDLDEKNSGLIVAHLGNGASICAVRNGQSVDTSMGMTPLEGLMMGTRSGDVDFGAMAWIAKETGQTLSDLERVVNKESGLLGISGLSSDLRVLEKAWHEGHERARLAIKTFVHRIARHIAGHAASLHRLDGIIFTGGIGENSVLIRRLVIDHLGVLGLTLDVEMNKQPNSHGERIISANPSQVICAVIPTNEEKMIALDAIHLGNVKAPVEFA
ncbi:propionate kinase [Salmonella enterica subsp. enterica serovar Hvittingfoss]|uniref:propionate kinase n=1 Tax=Salmonella TaxID=590 RepID=UPI000230A257|nr:propionate kinase [Salmonella enterica]EDR5811405.1 propionate kinase [Salmonella enterica subsp. enterica serovar Soumbedioune]EDT6747834.1 propionate kinase [Salmonella enterica subsp. enterica serovar Wandsworth]EEB2387459.1 propionate kinase [Salmonella enterica subsp. enterica serovar Rubislaw]EGB5303179.1 propionate kinase [Salmonella enterica subsp. enterica serovar 16:b:-]EHC46695.1 Propionate kinase [Salmonella enterica subsp. enterica serovar Hvittingfoss str. A4-620]